MRTVNAKQLAYSRGDAAHVLGVCVATIKNWEKAGILAPVKIGGRVLIPAEQLEALVYEAREGVRQKPNNC